MRYWLLRGRKPEGPFPPEQVVGLPEFDPGWLVCPEDLPTAERSNWRQARKVPELLERMLAAGGAPKASEPTAVPGRTRRKLIVAAAVGVAVAALAAAFLR